jgi:hypothetical protein
MIILGNYLQTLIVRIGLSLGREFPFLGSTEGIGKLKGFPFSLSLKHSDSLLNHTIKQQFE